MKILDKQAAADLAVLIRRKRQENKITARFLAEELGMHESIISRIEHGKFDNISDDVIKDVMHHLGIEYAVLIHRAFGSQIKSEWTETVHAAFQSDPEKLYRIAKEMVL